MGLRKRLGHATRTRSGYESRICKDLDSRDIKYGYEVTKLKYFKTICKHCGKAVTTNTYTPDYTFKNNLMVEAKGRLTSIDRTKYLCVLRDNPTINLRFIFLKNDRICKGSETFYSDWCERYGIIYTFGEVIPDEWLKAQRKQTK